MWLKAWFVGALGTILSYTYPPRVWTPLGLITGYYKTSENSRLYEVYEGVPYAKPPQGELRFKDPEPITKPFFKLQATKKRSDCAQYYDVPPDKNGQPVIEGSILGSDDCLYLNVYVPVLEEKRRKRMPVIFFIHGGSFQYASGNLFGDKYLADRDVIFVAVNYRLGILGFLSTEDEALPGNLGLKDQNLALRWVSKNIHRFGGDPSRVILAGFSAGSSSIQYHYLSPLSRGLFHGSVAMSGTAFNPWAFASHAREKALRLGALFNCTTDNTREMIDCLRKVPALTLVAATKKFQYWQYNPEAPWAPVVDKHSDAPFISKSPRDILEGKLLHDVPAVYGMVQNEGGDPVAEYAPHDNLLRELDRDWLDIAPHLLEINYTLPTSIHRQVVEEARHEYLGNRSIDKDTVPELEQMLTDQRYFIGFEEGIRLQARASRSPVFAYFYAFRGSQSYCDHLSRTKNNYGVCHTDDMNLVVENPDIVPTATRMENEMSQFLMDMWVSVAYNGIPDVGVTWSPVDASDPELKYLRIDRPGNYSMSGDSNLGRKSFWNKFYHPQGP